MIRRKPRSAGCARWAQTIVAIALFSTGVASLAQTPGTEPASAPALGPPVPVTPAVEQTLKALQDVDKTLDSFSADAVKVDTDVRSGDAETRGGSVYYQKKEGKTSLAFQVNKLAASGTPAIEKDEIYAFTPPWYFHRDSKKKEFERKEVVKPGDKVDPLKVGSGFLPLPIGQDPTLMEQEFTITEMPVDPALLPKDADAKDFIRLKLVPNPGRQYDFTEVQLTIDKKTNLPVAVEETKTDGNTTRFSLKNLQINKLDETTAKKVFDPARPSGTDWKISEDAK